MAEVIKHGVLADRELFAFIAEKDAKAYLGDIIPTNLVIKRRHVMEDEFDVGLRQLLNLGHTLAHAVEKLSHYEINHGNAVWQPSAGRPMLTVWPKRISRTAWWRY